MAKIVIDANVIISAAFGGKPLEAVGRALSNHEVYLSEKIREELEKTLIKISKKLSKPQLLFIQDKLRKISSLAHLVPITTHLTLSRDPTDDHYLALCKEAKADFLITGDKDLLEISPKILKTNGLACKIVSPSDFLELVP